MSSINKAVVLNAVVDAAQVISAKERINSFLAQKSGELSFRQFHNVAQMMRAESIDEMLDLALDAKCTYIREVWIACIVGCEIWYFGTPSLPAPFKELDRDDALTPHYDGPIFQEDWACEGRGL